MRRLHIHLLLFGDFTEVAQNIFRNGFYMLAALASIDTIGKAHVTLIVSVVVAKERPCKNSRHFPPLAAPLIGDRGFVFYEELRELLKGIGGKDCIVPRHLDFLPCERGDFNRPRLHDKNHLIHVETHKPREVRLEGDTHKSSLGFVFCHTRLGAAGHMVIPDLMILQTHLGVSCLHDERRAEDIGQLGAISILSTDNLLLLFIVVS